MSYMSFFHIIMAGVGVYLMYCASQMMKTGEISSVIVSPEEIVKCKDKKGFITAICKPTQIFGIISIVAGILNFVNDKFNLFGRIIGVAGVIIYVVAWFWYMQVLAKGKMKFFF